MREVILPRGELPTYQGASLDRGGLVATNGINLHKAVTPYFSLWLQDQILKMHLFTIKL